MTDVVCYYHDPGKAPLLRDAVLPALAAAQAAYPQVQGHLERHWLHGPHIRVRLRGSAAAEAAALVASRLREYACAHPSTVEIPVAELRERARVASIAELLQPPFEPFYPNNSVRIEPHGTSRLYSLLSSETLIELREHGLRLGVPAVRESLAHSVDTSQGRVGLAVTAMAAQAASYPNGIRFGYHSFQSHLEDFLLHSDPSGKVRDRFAAIWSDNVQPVTSAVRRVVEGKATDSLETAWQDWALGMRSATQEVYDRGELTAMLSPAYGRRAYEIGDPDAIRRYNFAERTEFSSYHTQLSTVDMRHPSIERPFVVYRFGINVLYQLLKICDVRPMERYLAASMVAKAVQRIFATTWSDQLAAMPQVHR